MARRSDLAIDPCRRLQEAIHREQTVQGNAKDGLVLFEIGLDEGPVLFSKWSELTAVELVLGHLVLRIPHVDCPTRGEGEEIPARIGGIQLADDTILIEPDAIHNDEPSTIERVTGHK